MIGGPAGYGSWSRAAAVRYLPKKATWLSGFESEIVAFPNDKHDDQVDSFTQFLKALDYKPRPLASLAFFRRR